MTTDTSKLPPTDLERRSKTITEIAAIITAGGVIVVAMSGSFQLVVDWARGTSHSQSQISAIDERLRWSRKASSAARRRSRVRPHPHHRVR